MWRNYRIAFVVIEQELNEAAQSENQKTEFQ